MKKNGFLLVIFLWVFSFGNNRFVLESELRTDYDGSGVNNFLTAYTYDAQGNRLMKRVWAGIDSLSGPISRCSYSYTINGLVAEELLLDQLGDAPSIVYAGLSGVTAISAGDFHTLALKVDKTVVAWGDDANGQSTVPAGLSGVVAVDGGGFHSVALKSDGTVAVWGDNAAGQCTIPVGLSGVSAISAGESHTVVLKSNGTVAAWGDNTNGQCTVPSALQ